MRNLPRSVRSASALLLGSLASLTSAACTATPSGVSPLPTTVTPPGTTAPTPAPVCSANVADSADVAALATADTAFAASFYVPATAAAGSSGNVIVSSYSAAATLMMVGAGAAGDTASQIQSMLQLPVPAANVASRYAGLACEDETQGNANGNQLVIANAVWVQQGKSFEASFTSALSSGFDAALQQTDFESDPGSAVTAVNSWVSQKTDGEIPTLLSPSDLTTDTRIVLVDAMYFKGVWDTGFDPSATSPAPFTLADGTEVQVPMMDGEVSVASSYSKAMNIVELPYKGQTLVMDFLQPSDTTTSLSQFEATLTASVLASAFETPMEYGQQEVQLPKFSFTTSVNLVPVLQGLGMTDAFVPHLANFSGMDGAEDLYVSFVVQQAQVTVDESGTVAAVATAAGGSEDSVAEIPLQIDTPFVFLIRDTTSGSILFMGHVMDPRQGS